MAQKTTLKELATLLGISVSTVSKALADSPEISEATKETVRALAKEKRYRPNMMARSLKNRQTKTLGVVIPNILSNFFAKTVAGIEREATRLGYSLVICLSNEETGKEKKSLDMLCNTGVDAIVISVASETQFSKESNHLLDVLHYEVPLVMFDRANDGVDCDSVVIDDFRGAVQATEYLLKTGCKYPALVSTLFNTSVGKERERGYKEAVKKAVGDFDGSIIYTSLDSMSGDLSGYLATHELDGVLAVDEQSAITVMNVLRQHGKMVPEDISVIGFTDGTLARNYYPSLTTVNQRAEEMGAEAVRLAISRIKNPNDAIIKKVLNTELIVRQSTK